MVWLTKLQTLFEFQQFFYYCSFSIPGSSTPFSSCVFLASSNLWLFLSLSWPWHSWRGLVSDSVVYPQFEFAWCFHMFALRLRIWGRISQEGRHVLPNASYQRLYDGHPHYHWWCWPWSLGWDGEDGCLHSKFTVFPFVMNIVGESLWDYAKILFLFKLPPTNFSTHRWILCAAITVAFASRWFLGSYIY